MELNEKKSKVMTFTKETRGRRKMIDFNWKGEVMEEVNIFCYLVYTLKENNDDDSHVSAVVGKEKQ